ncbi:MAG: hypothetical protein HQL69_11270 [Magnetococcales bacterium]|nr:hypothetical protein [Magnetococcales bacterium]
MTNDNITLLDLDGSPVTFSFWGEQGKEEPLRLGDGTFAAVFRIYRGNTPYAIKILYEKHLPQLGHQDVSQIEENQLASHKKGKKNETLNNQKIPPYKQLTDFYKNCSQNGDCVSQSDFLRNLGSLIHEITHPPLRNFLQEILLYPQIRDSFNEKNKKSGDIRGLEHGIFGIEAFSLGLDSQENIRFVNWCKTKGYALSGIAYVMELFPETLEDVLTSRRDDGYRNWSKCGYDYLKGLESKIRHSIVVDTFSRVVDCLLPMHGEGVSHRDIKPSNVFLGIQGRDNEQANITMKIGDYGFCSSNSGLPQTRARYEISNPNFAPIGTRHFRSPEQRDTNYRFYANVKIIKGNCLSVENQDSKYKWVHPIRSGDFLVFEKDLNTHDPLQIDSVIYDKNGKPIFYTKPATKLPINQEVKNIQVFVYKNIGINSDIFSLGCVFLDLLTCGEQSGEFIYDLLAPYFREGVRGEKMSIVSLVDRYHQETTTAVLKTFGELYGKMEVNGKPIPSDLIEVVFRCFFQQDPGAYCYDNLHNQPDPAKAIRALRKDLSTLKKSYQSGDQQDIRLETMFFRHKKAEGQSGGQIKDLLSLIKHQCYALPSETTSNEYKESRNLGEFATIGLIREMLDGKADKRDPIARIGPEDLYVSGKYTIPDISRLISSEFLLQGLKAIKEAKPLENHTLSPLDRFSHPFLYSPYHDLRYRSFEIIEGGETAIMEVMSITPVRCLPDIAVDDFISFPGEKNLKVLNAIVLGVEGPFITIKCLNEQYFNQDEESGFVIPQENGTILHYHNFLDGKAEQFCLAAWIYEFFQGFPTKSPLRDAYLIVTETIRLAYESGLTIPQGKLKILPCEVENENHQVALTWIIAKMIYWNADESYATIKRDEIMVQWKKLFQEGELHSDGNNLSTPFHNWKWAFQIDFINYLKQFSDDPKYFNLKNLSGWSQYLVFKENAENNKSIQVNITPIQIVSHLIIGDKPFKLFMKDVIKNSPSVNKGVGFLSKFKL